MAMAMARARVRGRGRGRARVRVRVTCVPGGVTSRSPVSTKRAPTWT